MKTTFSLADCHSATLVKCHSETLAKGHSATLVNCHSEIIMTFHFWATTKGHSSKTRFDFRSAVLEKCHSEALTKGLSLAQVDFHLVFTGKCHIGDASIKEGCFGVLTESQASNPGNSGPL